jgi:hypothetical protein
MSMQGSLSIERMCYLAQVSRAGFYRSLAEQMPVEEEMEVRSAIQRIAVEHRRRYGYRRITAELRRCGMLVNHKRVARIMREDNLLAVQPADLIADLCPASDEPASDSVKGLQVLLFDCLRRDKPHLRSADRLADRRSIIGVVLLRLQMRFDELRGNQPHSMPKRFENTGPMMSSLPRLQSDHVAWKIRKEIRHLPSTQPFLESKPAFLIGCVELKHILCGIKTYNARCWHGSPLLATLAKSGYEGRVHTIRSDLLSHLRTRLAHQNNVPALNSTTYTQNFSSNGGIGVRAQEHDCHSDLFGC